MNIFNVSFKKELERRFELECEKWVNENLGGEMLPTLANGEPAYCEEELMDQPFGTPMAVLLPSGEMIVVDADDEANALVCGFARAYRAFS